MGDQKQKKLVSSKVISTTSFVNVVVQ